MIGRRVTTIQMHSYSALRNPLEEASCDGDDDNGDDHSADDVDD